MFPEPPKVGLPNWVPDAVPCMTLDLTGMLKQRTDIGKEKLEVGGLCEDSGADRKLSMFLP